MRRRHGSAPSVGLPALAQFGWEYDRCGLDVDEPVTRMDQWTRMTLGGAGRPRAGHDWTSGNKLGPIYIPIHPAGTECAGFSRSEVRRSSLVLMFYSLCIAVSSGRLATESPKDKIKSVLHRRFSMNNSIAVFRFGFSSVNGGNSSVVIQTGRKPLPSCDFSDIKIGIKISNEI